MSEPSKLGNWWGEEGGGGSYSYIRVNRPQKQSISKEINCAEHEYMNMSPPPNYRAGYGPECAMINHTLLFILLSLMPDDLIYSLNW